MQSLHTFCEIFPQESLTTRSKLFAFILLTFSFPAICHYHHDDDADRNEIENHHAGKNVILEEGSELTFTVSNNEYTEK